MTATNRAAAVASTSAAPNPIFQTADRLLAHENTIDTSSPNTAATITAIATSVNTGWRQYTRSRCSAKAISRIANTTPNTTARTFPSVFCVNRILRVGYT